jgi:hypothetical protein
MDALFFIGLMAKDRLGNDFSYQAIIGLPDVLEGESPSMSRHYANAYATLKELHRFTSTDEMAYADFSDQHRGVRLDAALLPRAVFVVGDKEEGGQGLFTKIAELEQVAAAYLISDIRTPLNPGNGQPRVQDQENLGVLDPSSTGMPRSFSSVGVLRVGVPADALGDFVLLRMLREVLVQEVTADGEAAARAKNWIASQKLQEDGADEIQDALSTVLPKDFELVDLKGAITSQNIPPDKVAVTAKEIGDTHIRRVQQFATLLSAKSEELGAQVMVSLSSELDAIRMEFGAAAATAFLDAVEGQVSGHRAALQSERTQESKILERQRGSVDESTNGLSEAAKGWWGRKERVEQALDDLRPRIERLMTLSAKQTVKSAGLTLYDTLLRKVQSLRGQWGPISDSLKQRLANTESAIVMAARRLNDLSDIEKRGEGNRFSLVNAVRGEQFFMEDVLADKGAVNACRNAWIASGLLYDRVLPFEAWTSAMSSGEHLHVLQQKTDSLDLLSCLDRFYPTESDKHRCFQQIINLARPLFVLNADRKEPKNISSWIFGVHPELQRAFVSSYEQYFPGTGKVYAIADSKSELNLYQLSFGYTLYSLKSIDIYKNRYDQMIRSLGAARAAGRIEAPVDGWPEAQSWDEPFPKYQSYKDAARLLALGLGLSRCYPAKDTESPKFIFPKHEKGQEQFFADAANGSPVILGRSLAEAVNRLGDDPPLKSQMEASFEKSIEKIGRADVASKLSNDYLPILGQAQTEARTAGKLEEAEALGVMLRALREYLAGPAFRGRSV